MNDRSIKNRGMKQWMHAGKMLWLRTQEAARLMVGVGDYARYQAHMQSHHPAAAVMTEAEYFRHCQQSRYPGKDGAIKRCPC